MCLNKKLQLMSRSMHFLSVRVYFVRLNFVRVKSCITLIPCIKVLKPYGKMWVTYRFSYARRHNDALGCSCILIHFSYIYQIIDRKNCVHVFQKLSVCVQLQPICTGELSKHSPVSSLQLQKKCKGKDKKN